MARAQQKQAVPDGTDRIWLAPTIIFLLGALLSATAAWFFYDQGSKSRLANLQKVVDHRASYVRQNIEHHLDSLEMLAGFMGGAPDSNSVQFKAKQEKYAARASGLKAVLWVPRVSSDFLPQYEATRRLGGKRVKIRAYEGPDAQAAAAPKSVHYPVTFVAGPITATTMADQLPGLDVYTHPVIAEAIDRAHKSGRKVITSAIHLLPGTSRSVTAVFPVYAHRGVALPEGSDDLGPLAVIIGLFDVEAMLAQAEQALPSENMSIRVLDNSASSVSNRLVAQKAAVDGVSDATGSDTNARVWTSMQTVAGRTWSFITQPVTDKAQRQTLLKSLAVLALGLLLTLAATRYVLLLVQTRSALRREIRHREHKDEQLEQRVAFELLVSELAKEFINLDASELDERINSGLRRVCEFIHAEGADIGLLDTAQQRFSLSHEWRAKGYPALKPLMQDVPLDELPSMAEQLRQHTVWHQTDVGAMTEQYAQERALYLTQDIKAIIALPMISEGTLFGFLRVEEKNQTGGWDKQRQASLRLTAEVFSAAIQRKQSLVARADAEKHISQLKYTDSNTGLPNRSMLQDMLTRMIEGLRGTQKAVAVIHIDMDRFNVVADSFGSQGADEAMAILGARLSKVVHGGDILGRIGSDEFAVLVWLDGKDEKQHADHLARYAEFLLDVLSDPLFISGNEAHLTASAGISTALWAGAKPDVLLKQAGQAVRLATAKGAGKIAFYSSELEDLSKGRLKLESDMRHALEDQQFELYYQPQIDLDGSRIIGAEVLLRWPHPERGFISPLDFIPLAEENGLIVPLGKWVLFEACKQGAQWHQQGYDWLRLGVNLSGVQFRQEDLVDMVTGMLKHTEFDPLMLELEITESSLIADAEYTVDTLKRLRELGVNFAIDDFGTGYSSMAYLKKFPLDRLKIDQAFVRDLLDDANDAAIVKATISLAHGLGLAAIAEGVETEAHREMLLSLGCDEAQGWHFGKPMPANEFEQLLIKRGRETE